MLLRSSPLRMGGFAFALITIVASVLIIQSESIAEAVSTVDMGKTKVPAGMNRVLLTITDWPTFTMLVRQSLFMTRLYEVFITTIKHYWNLSSYHTSINKYSDATNEEVKMLTQGDSTKLGDSDFTDDQTVVRILEAQRRTELDRHKREAYMPADNDDDIWSSAGIDKVERTSDVPDIPEESLGIIAQETQNEETSLKAGVAGMLSPGFSAVNKVQNIVNLAYDWLSAANRASESNKEARQVIVHKDWRETGCIGLPRDQGYCESCYAFSSTAFAEWAFCRHQEGKFTRLSPQYIINCASQFNPIEFFGCDRGPIRLVPDFFKEYGLELESNLPYVEKTQECPIDESSSKESWGSIRPIVEPTIRLRNNTDKLDKALGLRPVILSMFTPKNFIGYADGYIDDCDPENGGHAVLLVGSMSENDIDYLLAQNSLGAFWGLQGYFKIKRTPEFLSKCVKHFMVPDIKFSI